MIVCAQDERMEGDFPERSGAQSRVSSAASSHVNEEEGEDEVKASPTSLVSSQCSCRNFPPKNVLKVQHLMLNEEFSFLYSPRICVGRLV